VFYFILNLFRSLLVRKVCGTSKTSVAGLSSVNSFVPKLKPGQALKGCSRLRSASDFVKTTPDKTPRRAARNSGYPISLIFRLLVSCPLISGFIDKRRYEPQITNHSRGRLCHTNIKGLPRQAQGGFLAIKKNFKVRGFLIDSGANLKGLL
jgi:hypothetical protein